MGPQRITPFDASWQARDYSCDTLLEACPIECQFKRESGQDVASRKIRINEKGGKGLGSVLVPIPPDACLNENPQKKKIIIPKKKVKKEEPVRQWLIDAA